MRRLNQLYKPDAPGLLAAHNDYIAEFADRVVQKKDQELLTDLQKWFEEDLQNIGVLPNATTYALMIRATSKERSTKAERMMRMYLELAEGIGVREETTRLVSQWENEAQDALPDPDNPFDTPFSRIEETSSLKLGRALQPIDGGSPEVKEMKQKGLGLSSLKNSLSIFSNSTTTASLDQLHNSGWTRDNAIQRQKLLEQNTIDAAVDRWRAEDTQLKRIGVNTGLSTPSIGSMLLKWHEVLVPIIREEVRKSVEAEKKEVKTQADIDRLLWGPYLQFLAPEKISVITILSALQSTSFVTNLDASGTRLHTVVRDIGEAIHDESIVESIKSKEQYTSTVGSNKSRRFRKRQPQNSFKKLISSQASNLYDRLEWDLSSMLKVGAVVLSFLMDIAKVPIFRRDPKSGVEMQELQPVFFHTYQYMAGKRVGIVRLSQAVTEKLAKSPVNTAITKYLPMVAEPKPWVGFRDGGFYEHPVPVVRLSPMDVQQKKYAVAATENGDMDQVFAGLDVLGKTQWRINRFVFDIMLQAWNTGEAIAKIPPENPLADHFSEPPADDPLARAKWMRLVRESENHRAGLRSQRCFQNFQLEVARAYLNETFHFPHNCDFRGRAYPIAPFFNHMGSDNCRGLILFAEGKELTSTGLWWLKVHLANVFGYDKASFDERVKFANDHLNDIEDSVNNPLNGNRWWLQAEDPWQCLATCKELVTALELPDPTKYVCRLAIHQDGTCNGLQHYAALGGDVVGAQQVNLEPGRRPSDIYTAVAESVKAGIANDAAKGNELAQSLDGKVSRKVVKQTVMTNVYGVTFMGAKKQVQKQLDELFPAFPNTATLNRTRASGYVARKIFSALSQMFNGAHDIQYWLGDCAARICDSLTPEQIAYIANESQGDVCPSQFKVPRLRGTPKDELTAFKSSVIWTTPLKMPVVQPYRKTIGAGVQTRLQLISFKKRTDASPVDKKKQLQAFPPNFIHSLDATHMFLTALKCNEVGLTFASIHDSFWTHAGDVDTMNRIIRDAFIRMHSEDIIGRLAAEFKARYKSHMYMLQVRRDSSLGQKIDAWRKKQPKAKNMEEQKRNELLLEKRRLDLLASARSADREEGKSMVTAGTIFEQNVDEQALAPEGTQPILIGGMSRTPLRSVKLEANKQLEVGDIENEQAANPTKDVNVSTRQVNSSTAEALNAEAVGDTVGEHPVTAIADTEQSDPDTCADVAEDPELLVEKESEPSKRPRKRHAIKKVWVWLPLTFPPVPKKVY